MRIKLEGKINSPKELFERLISACMEIDWSEANYIRGVNLYFNVYDEDDAEVEFYTTNGNQVEMIINKSIKRKPIKKNRRVDAERQPSTE